MAVKEGFKNTDVGVIPEDWDETTVGQQFDVQLGKMLDAAKNRGQAKHYLGNRHVQWARIETEDLPQMPFRPNEEERYLLKVGDLLVCEGGEIGRSAIWKGELAECYYQKALHRLRPKNGYIPELLAAYLRYWTMGDHLSDFVSQTSIAHLTREKLESVPLPKPPLPEQRAIAAALSDVDELIEGLEALIAKKQALKQGAMQELLTGKRRLPGFEGKWEEKRLGDVAKIVGGGTPSTNQPSFWNGDIHWCTPTDLTQDDGKYLTRTERKITTEGVKNSSAAILPIGTLLFCSRASIGELKIAAIPTTTNQGFQSIVCAERSHNEFLYYLISQNLDKFVELAKGSTFLEISGAAVGSVVLAMPPINEQQAIASVLSDMDADISELQGRLSKTRALKQGMMQELLTGRIRLA